MLKDDKKDMIAKNDRALVFGPQGIPDKFYKEQKSLLKFIGCEHIYTTQLLSNDLSEPSYTNIFVWKIIDLMSDMNVIIFDYDVFRKQEETVFCDIVEFITKYSAKRWITTKELERMALAKIKEEQ